MLSYADQVMRTLLNNAELCSSSHKDTPLNDTEYAYLFVVLGVTCSVQENKYSSFLVLIIEWLSNLPASFQYCLTSLFSMLVFDKYQV